MKLLSLKCPECNANLNLNIEKSQKYFFCQYCGSKILIYDGATSHTYRKIDEARIKESETHEKIRLKELSFEEMRLKLKEKQRKSAENAQRLKTVLIAIFIIAILICLYIGYSNLGTSDFSYGFFGAGIFGLVILFKIMGWDNEN